MADYAIGDVQGCFDPLMRLLEKIDFNEQTDRLWFVGDLVNRGPDSLKVLRFVKSLPKVNITLGNHDLYLLARIFGAATWTNADDTLSDVLAAPDAEALGHWLRQYPFIYQDATLGVVMSHAGIAPCWTLDEAITYAGEVSDVLSGDDFLVYLAALRGSESHWSASLTGLPRLRTITNYFTRMRFCDAEGHLALKHKGPPDTALEGCMPWYLVPGRRAIAPDIVFGHWAALMGKCPVPGLYAIDTGCVWGNALTALRLQDRIRIVSS